MNLVHNNIFSRWMTIFFSLTLVFFMACENNGDDTGVIFEDEEKSAYEAEESAEKIFDVVESITNSAIRYSETSSGGRVAQDPELACAVVSFDGNRESGRVEIDFGEGCEGPDGKTRKGIIVVEYEGHWLVKNSKIFTVLKNFSVDGVKIEGTRILTNVSVDLENVAYAVEIIGGKITWPREEADDVFMTIDCDRLHTWIFGDSLDDFELHVQGQASGKTITGKEYSTVIDQPLVFKSSCRGNTIYLPASGSKTITIPEKPVININYGDGVCDNKLTISIENQDKEVTI